MSLIAEDVNIIGALDLCGREHWRLRRRLRYCSRGETSVKTATESAKSLLFCMGDTSPTAKTPPSGGNSCVKIAHPRLHFG